MPGPVSRESSSSVDLEGGVEPTREEQVGQVETTARNEVESWIAQEHGFSGPTAERVEDEAPTFSPHDLQLQAERLTRKQGALEDGFTAVLQPLQEAAQSSGQADLAFIAAAMGSEQLKTMLKTLSRSEVNEGVRRIVADTLPDASNGEVQKVTARLMSHLGTAVTTETAQRLRETVVDTLHDAARRFTAAANDPREVLQITTTYAELTAPWATDAQRAAAEKMASVFGLPGSGKTLSQSEVRGALIERGALIQNEAGQMQRAGENTLYRSLLLHSQVGPALIERSGIQPGSWAERGLARVQERGVADENALKISKFTSSIALIAVSGGAGLGVTAAALAGAGYESANLSTAWHDVDRAGAGASAGTAAANAESIARRKATFDTVAAGVTVVAGAALGSAIHGDPHSVIDFTARNVAIESAAELVMDRAPDAIWTLTRPEEEAAQPARFTPD